MSYGAQWIKIVPNIFDDEKIKLIEAMPHGDTIIVIWFKLLAQAGKVNDRGLIYIIEHSPITVEMLASVFNRPAEIITLALDTFEQFGMIEYEEHINIVNWDLYQNIDELEKIREQNRLRKQKSREKQAVIKKEKNAVTNSDLSRDSHVTSHANVTPCHALELEIEEELRINNISKRGDNIKNININISSPNPPLTDVSSSQETQEHTDAVIPPFECSFENYQKKLSESTTQKEQIETTGREPSEYFKQLRTVYNRYKNEGSMAGWQEFKVYEKDKSNPDVLSLISDIEERSGSDQWKKGYIPSLAKYLKQKLWEQPVSELQDFRKANKPEDFVTFRTRLEQKTKEKAVKNADS